MMDKVLVFIGVVLLLFPTWLYLQTFTSPSRSLIDRSLDSVRIFRQSSNRQSKGGMLISFFQSWGLLWLLSGIIIGILGDKLSGNVLAIVILVTLFIGPLILFIVAKRQGNINRG